jgi:hypothetical protein
MGIELFFIVVLIALGVGALLFVSGAFGAVAAKPESEREGNPKHVYVENETRDRIVGGTETTEQVRAQAESDPDTEVRS